MPSCQSLSFSLVLLVAGHGVAVADPQPQRTIQPATFAQRDAAPPQIIRFGNHVPSVGDQADQDVSLEVRLSTIVRKGNTIAEKSTTTVRNVQQRVLTTIETRAGRTIAVEVYFADASKQVQHAAENPTSNPRDEDAKAMPQPVAGKTYRCRRAQGENGKLVVTDRDGNIPPLAEYDIVARTMDSVGRPNPFTEFLAGRQIQVGETVALPASVADRLFGLGDDFGKVQRFDLTLRQVETRDGIQYAVFHASVDAAAASSSQMRLQVEGPLVVEIQSCRAVRMELSGPVAMSESRGSYSTAYQLLGTGKLHMSIASAYRDADR